MTDISSRSTQTPESQPWSLYVGDALAETRPQLGGHVLVEADVTVGVRAIELEYYRGSHTRICRPVGLDAAEIDKVIAHAAHRIGQQYDMRNIVDLVRYLLPTPPVPSRWRRRWPAPDDSGL